MRRKLIVLIGAVATAFFIAGGAAPQGKPHPFSFSNLGGSGQTDLYLEQQNCRTDGVTYCYSPEQRVVNSVQPCAWDVNDHSGTSGDGNLAAGATARASQCVVAYQTPICRSYDGQTVTCVNGHHSISYATLSAPVQHGSPQDVTLQVCYQPQGVCFTPQPHLRADGTAYDWVVLSQAVYWDTDPALSIIPGSTPDPLPWGTAPGLGLIQTITVTATNATGATVKDLAGSVGISSDVFGMQFGSTGYPTQVAYPFRWEES